MTAFLPLAWIAGTLASVATIRAGARIGARERARAEHPSAYRP